MPVTSFMTNNLQSVEIKNYLLPNGECCDFQLTYEVFGSPLFQAPVILVNHALTGNSTVTGEKGWWKNLIGKNQIIDTQKYTIIAFNIPGNQYQNRRERLPISYQYLTTKIVADLFWKGLKSIGIQKLYAVVGCSLGGGISWEMAFLKPKSITHLIPVAANLKSSDWLIGQTFIQDILLNQSANPIYLARIHAMLLYRTPISIRQKFEFFRKNGISARDVASWLDYHGKTLQQRFSLPAYKQMNYLLGTIGLKLDDHDIINFAKQTDTQIHIISVESDLLFPQSEIEQFYRLIKKHHQNISLQNISSPHGHDAFLIEYDILNQLLSSTF